jgi:hypothetical protein
VVPPRRCFNSVNGVAVAEAGFVGTDGEGFFGPLFDNFYDLQYNSTALTTAVQDIDTCEVRDPALLVLGSNTAACIE